jgi:hypothetical protein
VTLVDAIAFIRECRDSHVPAAEALTAVPGAQWPGGDAAFHRECVEGYDEALEALERGRALLAAVFGPVFGVI